MEASQFYEINIVFCHYLKTNPGAVTVNRPTHGGQNNNNNNNNKRKAEKGASDTLIHFQTLSNLLRVIFKIWPPKRAFERKKNLFMVQFLSKNLGFRVCLKKKRGF